MSYTRAAVTALGSVCNSWGFVKVQWRTMKAHQLQSEIKNNPSTMEAKSCLRSSSSLGLKGSLTQKSTHIECMYICIYIVIHTTYIDNRIFSWKKRLIELTGNDSQETSLQQCWGDAACTDGLWEASFSWSVGSQTPSCLLSRLKASPTMSSSCRSSSTTLLMLRVSLSTSTLWV